MGKLTPRFWTEAALVAGLAFISLIPLLRADWIELLFDVDPDNDNGSLELAITIGALTGAVAFFASARAEWRRVRSPSV